MHKCTGHKKVLGAEKIVQKWKAKKLFHTDVEKDSFASRSHKKLLPEKKLSIFPITLIVVISCSLNVSSLLGESDDWLKTMKRVLVVKNEVLKRVPNHIRIFFFNV